MVQSPHEFQTNQEHPGNSDSEASFHLLSYLPPHLLLVGPRTEHPQAVSQGKQGPYSPIPDALRAP